MDILLLPNEILSIIFEYVVPQKDLVTSRLVCRKWKEKIDSLATFSIVLNEEKSNHQKMLQRFLSLRVRRCKITRLKEPIQFTLQNPLLVKEIVFSNVSNSNVHQLLSVCSSVEKISIFTTLLSDIFFNLDPASINLYLKKIQEIQIGIQVFDFGAKQQRSSSTFTTFFNNSQPILFSSISRICIHYAMTLEEWTQFFAFIARHHKTLRSLKISCFECPSSNGSSNSVHQQSATIDLDPCLMKQLEEVKLSLLKIICCCACTEDSIVHNTFSKLLSTQSQLEILNLDYHGCPLKVIKRVVKNSSPTLQIVKLHKLEFGVGDELDGGIFSDCVRLRQLKLHCLPRVMVYVMLDYPGSSRPSSNCNRHSLNGNVKGTTRIVSKGSETTGWNFLPSTLEHCYIKNCHIPTSELLELSQNVKKLKSLELQDIGSRTSYDYGLTFPAFISLCSNLQQLESISFRSISFTDSSTKDYEMRKWIKVLTAGREYGIVHAPERFTSELLSKLETDNENLEITAAETFDSDTLFTFTFNSKTIREEFVKRVNELIAAKQLTKHSKEAISCSTEHSTVKKEKLDG